MSEQLEIAIKQSMLAAEKATEIYHGMECLFRRSSMASQFELKYPELALQPLDFTPMPIARNVTVYAITSKRHPLAGLTYYSYEYDGNPRPEYPDNIQSLHGCFDDSEETVLRYLRKDLFEN